MGDKICLNIKIARIIRYIVVLVYGVIRFILLKVNKLLPPCNPYCRYGYSMWFYYVLFLGIFGKYVIDLMQSEESVASNTESLLRLIIIAGLVATVLGLFNTYSENKTWYRFIYVRMQLILERIDKALMLIIKCWSDQMFWICISVQHKLLMEIIMVLKV